MVDLVSQQLGYLFQQFPGLVNFRGYLLQIAADPAESTRELIGGLCTEGLVLSVVSLSYLKERVFGVPLKNCLAL